MQKIRPFILPGAIILAFLGALLGLATHNSVLVQFLFIIILGTLTGAVALATREEQQSGRDLARVAQTYQVLLHALAEGVIVHDAQFTIKDMNENAETITGVHKSEVQGVEITPDMLGSEKLKMLARVLYPTIGGSILERKATGQMEYLEVYFEDPSPTYLRIGVGQIRDDRGEVTGYFRIFSDRTAETLAFQNQAEFLSNAAHQLRTPLTQVRWVFETLKDNPTDTSIIKKGLEILIRALTSIDAMLTMVRLEGRGMALAIEQNDLGEVITEAVNNFQISFSMAGVTSSFTVKNPVVPFKFDRQKVYEVVTTLLDNAIRYNKPGGTVTVELNRIADRPYAEVSVADTGIGIPDKELPHIFQKFYRASNVRGAGVSGFGIGLYIARRIVEAHGGSLAITSHERAGTTVTFTLPLQESLIPQYTSTS